MGIQKAEARMLGSERIGVCGKPGNEKTGNGKTGNGLYTNIGKPDIGISYIGVYSVRAGIILNAGFRPLYVCV